MDLVTSATTLPHPRTQVVSLPALDIINLTLRPIPPKITRLISTSLKNTGKLIEKATRLSTVVQTQIDLLSKDYMENKLTLEEFSKKSEEVFSKLSDQTGEELDSQIADAVVNAFCVIIGHYGYTLNRFAVEEKIPLEDIIDFLDAQVELNGVKDFLLSSLKVLLALIKETPKELEKQLTAAFQITKRG